jgi:hypothetical protein
MIMDCGGKRMKRGFVRNGLTRLVVCAAMLAMVTASFGTTVARADDPLISQVSVVGGDVPGDYIYSMCTSADGSYVVCGWLNQLYTGIFAGAGNGKAFIIKYAADDTLLWVKRFGGTYNESFKDVIQTTDGGYVAVGSSMSYDQDMAGIKRGGYNGDQDAIIVKYDSNGNLVWKRCFGGSFADWFSAVTQTSDGSLVVVGESRSDNGDMRGIIRGNNVIGDGIIIKYNANGSILWKKAFGGTAEDRFEDIALDGNDGCVVVGSTSSQDIDLSPSNFITGAIILHYDSNGNRDWFDVWGIDNTQVADPLRTGSYFYGVCRTTDGCFVATGYTASNSSYVYSDNGVMLRNGGGFVFKYDAVGQLVWKTSIDGSVRDELGKVAPTTNGGVIIAGATNSTDYDLTGIDRKKTGVYMDAILVKLMPDGTKVWIRTFGGNGNDDFSKVVPLQGSEFIAAGSTTSTTGDFDGIKNTTNPDGFIAKFIIPDLLPPTIAANSFTVELSFSDDMSGVAAQEYAWSNSDTEFPTEWTAYTGPITQSTEGTWYLWAKATDGKGNTAILCVGGPYVVGTIAP